MTAGNTKLFRTRVLAVVAALRKGETMSYGEVARRAGTPKAARAVGAILKTNFDPGVPCHRVVCKDGSPGGYNRGTAKKLAFLKEEAGG